MCEWPVDAMGCSKILPGAYFNRLQTIITDHQSGEILVAAYSASNYHGNIYTLIYAARGNKGNKTGQYKLALFTQSPGMAWIPAFGIRRTL